MIDLTALSKMNRYLFTERKKGCKVLRKVCERGTTCIAVFKVQERRNEGGREGGNKGI